MSILTLLLHEKLLELHEVKVPVLPLYPCVQYYKSSRDCTTFQQMLRQLTAQAYVDDRELWDKERYIHEKRKEPDPEDNTVLRHIFGHMVIDAKPESVVFILIDGFDIIKYDEDVKPEDIHELFSSLKSAIEFIGKQRDQGNQVPIVKLLLTFHLSCSIETQRIWAHVARTYLCHRLRRTPCLSL